MGIGTALPLAPTTGDGVVRYTDADLLATVVQNHLLETALLLEGPRFGGLETQSLKSPEPESGKTAMNASPVH